MPLLFQLLQQHLLVIAGKLLTLPFDGNRSLLLRLGSRGIVAFTCPVGFSPGRG